MQWPGSRDGVYAHRARLCAWALGLSLAGSVLVPPLWTSWATAAAPSPVPGVLISAEELHARILSGKELSTAELRQLQALPLVLKKQFAPRAIVPQQGPLRFLSLSGQTLAPGGAIPSGGVRVLPVAPGSTVLALKEGPSQVAVLGLSMVSVRALGLVPRTRLSISHSLPAELALSAESAEPDPEAVMVRLVGPESALPSVLSLISFSPEDRYLDALQKVALHSAPCPSKTEMLCATTAPIRLVADAVERGHPKITERSLVAEVGGEVEVRLADEVHRQFQVGAPDGLSEPDSDPGRYRMKIVARLINMQRGGPPPVGESEDEAIRLVRAEMAAASRVFSQCGMVLGPPEEWDVQVVDPPEIALFEVGCRGGLPATGGRIGLRITPHLGPSKEVFVRTRQGQVPREVARSVRWALEKQGFAVDMYRNAQVAHAALPSFDLLVSDRGGRSVSLTPVKETWTDDPTLGLCLGELNLGDGLEHFNDFNAAAGTLEERVLLRAFTDHDPTTIDLIVVPLFAGVGRIGESFIRSPGGSLRNALILDRGGIRAGARSLTLAHELGHILLEMPGHPDDFGVDTPTSLMDADAADASIFGPRRLSINDCRRALRQSGPEAQVPLLQAWPLL